MIFITIQGGYVFAFVCLSVSRITQKIVDEFLLFFWRGEMCDQRLIRHRIFYRKFYHYGIMHWYEFADNSRYCPQILYSIALRPAGL